MPLKRALVPVILLVAALWPQGCDCEEDLQRQECSFTVEPSGPSQPIEFGEVEVDRERARPVRIENTGNVRLSEFEFEFAERNGMHYRLAMADDFAVDIGTSEDIQVIFHPLAESPNLGSSFTVTHARIGGEGGEGCPAFSVTVDGTSFERIDIPDGGVPDGGDGDGDGDGDAGVPDGGDGDGDGGTGVFIDAGPIVPPDAGFDPDDNLEFQARGALQEARSDFAAVSLSDGTILAVGGYGPNGQALDSVEQFDPETGISSIVGHMAVPRAEPGAAELPSGRVVIVGGASAAVGGLAVTTVEVWEPGVDPETSVVCVTGQGDCLLDDIDTGEGLLEVGRLDPLVAAFRPDTDGGLAPEKVAVLLGRTLNVDDEEVLAEGGVTIDLSNMTPVVEPLSGADSILPRTGEARVIGPDGSFLVASGQGELGILGDVWVLDATEADPGLVELASISVTPRVDGDGAVLESGDVVLAGGSTTGGDLLEGLERITSPFDTPEVSSLDVDIATRVGGSLVSLPGDVLLWAGGAAVPTAPLEVAESVVPLTTADLLVPFVGDSFLRVAPDNELATPRLAHQALPFGEGPDGVVFLGGVATAPRITPHPAAERYRLDDNAFEVWGLMGPGTAFEPMANSGEGAILTAGGVDPHSGAISSRVRVFDLDDDSFYDAPPLAAPRRDHSATRLSDNAAYLVAGGRDPAGQVLGTASIYVPLNEAGFDEPLPFSLNRPRAEHSATALPDGRVLLCGGVGTGGEPLDTCEVFTPPSGLQNPNTYDEANFNLAAGRMSTGRVGHTATLLQTGEVLLVGGGDVELDAAPADLFDPTEDRVDETAQPSLARRDHVAVFLGSGRVLIAGGEVYLGGFAATESAELYERQNEVFVPVGDMTTARIGAGSVLFNDGSVLIVGGSQEDDAAFPTRSLRTAERYLPDPFGVGEFESFDLPLTYGRSAIQLSTVFGRGAMAGGDHRDGALGTGAERRTPLFFVDRLIDLGEE